MNIPVHSSLVANKMTAPQNQEEIWQAHLARFLQRMARTGQMTARIDAELR